MDIGDWDLTVTSEILAANFINSCRLAWILTLISADYVISPWITGTPWNIVMLAAAWAPRELKILSLKSSPLAENQILTNSIRDLNYLWAMKLMKRK